MLEQYRFPLKDNPGYSASIPQLHRNFLLSADFSVASWLRRLTCDWEIVVSFAAIPHFSAKIGKSSLASVPTSILWYQSKKKIYLSQSMSREHDPLWPPSWRGLYPIKLSLYASSPGNMAHCNAELAISSQAMAKNHHQYSLYSTAERRPGSVGLENTEIW